MRNHCKYSLFLIPLLHFVKLKFKDEFIDEFFQEFLIQEKSEFFHRDFISYRIKYKET